MRVANNRASRPFSLNQTGTLLNRHLAQFVSAIDTLGVPSGMDSQFVFNTSDHSLWWAQGGVSSTPLTQIASFGANVQTLAASDFSVVAGNTLPG